MLENVEFNIAGGLNMDLPRMARVRQLFEHHGLDDVAGAVRDEMARPEIIDRVKSGASIAVGVGSRGVNNIATVTKAVVEALQAKGAKPFIFPAMGSHGGGTVDGQVTVLRHYGITDETMGAPIRATMDTVVVDEMDDGTPLHVDRFAHEADGIVLINRVKPHTNFRGPIESGVVKMLTIGMGKIAGATTLHAGHPMENFGTELPKAADKIMAKVPFLFGIGLVEDSFDDTCIVEALPAETLYERECVLQARAKETIAKLMFDDIDVLIIDQIGKNISGAGADPNVTGRNVRGAEGFDHPRVKKLVLLDLTDETEGNATGFACADVITQRLLSRIDFAYTYANVVTSTYLDGAKIPIPMKTAEDAVRLALKTLNGIRPSEARVVRIKNTLDLIEIGVSESMLDEVRANDRLKILSEPGDIRFDAAA